MTFLSPFLLFYPRNSEMPKDLWYFSNLLGIARWINGWKATVTAHTLPSCLDSLSNARSFIHPRSSKSSTGDWLSRKIRMIKSDQSHCLPLWPTSSLSSHLQHLILNRKCSIYFDHWCIQDSLKGQHSFHLSSSQATLLLLSYGKIRLWLITSVSCNFLRKLTERKARESQGRYLPPFRSIATKYMLHELWLSDHREIPARLGWHQQHFPQNMDRGILFLHFDLYWKWYLHNIANLG